MSLLDLLQRLEELAGHEMTAEERFEQKVSFVFGMLDADSDITKDEVREILRNA